MRDKFNEFMLRKDDEAFFSSTPTPSELGEDEANNTYYDQKIPPILNDDRNSESSSDSSVEPESPTVSYKAKMKEMHTHVKTGERPPWKP